MLSIQNQKTATHMTHTWYTVCVYLYIHTHKCFQSKSRSSNRLTHTWYTCAYIYTWYTHILTIRTHRSGQGLTQASSVPQCHKHKVITIKPPTCQIRLHKQPIRQMPWWEWANQILPMTGVSKRLIFADPEANLKVNRDNTFSWKRLHKSFSKLWWSTDPSQGWYYY